MRQMALERGINIAINGRSWWRLRAKIKPLTAMLITHSRDTCLIKNLFDFILMIT